jgi:uncharacterized repeat protein (TIGR01451 family)
MRRLWQMGVLGLLVPATLALSGGWPGLASAAAAAAAADAAVPSLTVAITVDQPRVTVELGADGAPTAPVPLTYTIVVENTGDQPVPGVSVAGRLDPGLVAASEPVAFAVGDLAPGGGWQGTFGATVDQPRLDRPVVSAVAVATATDGTEVTSDPAVTAVDVISASTTDRVAPAPVPSPTPATPAPARPAPPAKTEVLGVAFLRGPGGGAVSSLPTTGSPLLPLAGLGLALVVAGAVLLGRTSQPDG